MSGQLRLKNIRVHDTFFSPRVATARRVTIPYMWETLHDRVPGVAPSGCIQNFEIAAGLKQGSFIGYCFQDSDLWKWIEGAAYSLAVQPDAGLEKQVDEAIALAAAAQLPDGYLDTYYILKEGPDKRLTNLKDHHELYIAGHMFEAACAYLDATGKDTLLRVACRFADYICEHLGPDEGMKQGYPGHEEVEMGLARLYAATGEKKYLDQALLFLDRRGRQPYYYDQERQNRGEKVSDTRRNQWETYSYYQADVPVREQTVARGHAVRQCYLLAGMAEAGAQAGDETLLDAAERVFDNITAKQMYITGGVGATHEGEAFTLDYDLPPERCYTETCASIALIMTARRLHRARPDGKYGAVVEKALYNGILSGISLDGTKYFYMNPLEVWPERCEKRQDLQVDAERQGWFGCACCPPNILRTLTGLGHYLYTDRDDGLYVDQYVTSDLETDRLSLCLTSGFPWNGQVTLKITGTAGQPVALHPRVPDWARGYSLALNGESLPAQPKHGYLRVERVWQRGDTLTLDFPMRPMLIRASTRVPDYAGKVAIQRGPLIYCLEEADNGSCLWNLCLKPGTLTEQFEPDLLGGVMTLRGQGLRESGEGPLYTDTAPETETVPLRFVPYYAWGNRGRGEMSVWVRRA